MTNEISFEKFSNNKSDDLEKTAFGGYGVEHLEQQLNTKEQVMGNIIINNIKDLDEKIESNFNEEPLRYKPTPTKKYGISLYGNVWYVGDAYNGERQIECNDVPVVLHYEIATHPVLRNGEKIETSDHFDMKEVISAPIVKVVELTEFDYKKLQEALKAIHEAYGAVKITQDPINNDLCIEGMTKNGYEIVGHITGRGAIKEYEIQPNTPYKNNDKVLDAAVESFTSTMAEDKKVSDDDRTKLLCDVLERLQVLGKDIDTQEIDQMFK